MPPNTPIFDRRTGLEDPTLGQSWEVRFIYLLFGVDVLGPGDGMVGEGW